MKLFIMALSIMFLQSIAVSEEKDATRKLADDPANYYKNIIKYRLDASPSTKITPFMLHAIEACFERARKNQVKEFIASWNGSSEGAFLYVYEGDTNFLIEFLLEGIGGGFSCFVDKNKNVVVWGEAQY